MRLLANPFQTARVRGHRIVGPLRIHRERRHYVLAITGLVVAIASAATSAYASYAQAQQQQEAAKFNADIARNQAIANQQAAEVQAQQRETQTRRLLASQRAAAGASGITTEGSPLAVMQESAAQGAYEAGLTRAGGAYQAEALFGEAGIQKHYGNQAGAAGPIRAGTTLLSGTGSALNAYAQYKASSVNPSGYAPGNANVAY